MQNNLSTQLFERISNLTNTLKLETLELVNKVNLHNRNDSEDSTSEDSVILIEPADELENNSFLKLLNEKRDSMTLLRNQINETDEKNCSKVSLEDLVNIAATLHVNIEDSITYMCNKMKMDEEEAKEYKSPLDDSVPVSLFKSNIKEKFLNQAYDDRNITNNDDLTKPDGSELDRLLDEMHDQNDLDCVEIGVKINPAENGKKAHNFSVNDLIIKPEKEKNINVVDLNNLGLSEETRKLLGLE